MSKKLSKREEEKYIYIVETDYARPRLNQTTSQTTYCATRQDADKITRKHLKTSMRKMNINIKKEPKCRDNWGYIVYKAVALPDNEDEFLENRIDITKPRERMFTAWGCRWDSDYE